MAATFRPVNSPLSAADPPREDSHATAMAAMTTTVALRPTTAPAPSTQPLDDGPTPTRATFAAAAGTLASQKPLPNTPFPESVQVPTAAAAAASAGRKREHSQHSRRSKESPDVDMDDSDAEPHANDDHVAASDDDSANADDAKSKKKKSQRFYCTDYPPCNLSFTRSEHLARHIRKHTGERPFQCHCSRRFSRLDNLRQHAQTVHVNEDIPIDSLAASGTRFQRQIRTDRVRQTGRARASTAGSVGPGGRGHSKSLSTSNIPSLSPLASAYSLDARRRPAPLVMADNRPQTSSLESFRGPDGQFYRPPSPGDFSTPTSATFSTGQGSPRWGPVMSPGSSHSRSHSMYAAPGSRTPGRRLSVPSAGNPFHAPHNVGARGPVFGPPGVNSSNSGAFSPAQSSLLSSPTASAWSRRDSTSSAVDEGWRRRTWHPDTRDYAGPNRLSQVAPPPEMPSDKITLPPLNPTNLPPKQDIVLPPIESFDRIPPPPRKPSPMLIDSETPPSYVPRPEFGRDERPSSGPHWDAGLHHGLNRLDINTPPRETAGSWANEANQALLARAEQARVRFEPEVRTMPPAPAPAPAPMQPGAAPTGMMGSRHHHTLSAPAFSTPRESRRHGWYNGPVTVHPPRTSETIPEQPRAPHVDRIVHPNVSSWRGFPARQEQQLQQPPQPHQHQQPVYVSQGPPPMERIPERPTSQHPGSPESLRRLEALVAVATGQGPVATAS
ncbi:hypothetical protein VTJ83DRAFT_2859 [Remersonia thermophila]|uniref:C2H2-type domain-containing protein n=1 Tax=Remersonia thermophila TaxID=72144 RepID=A0ABR4DCD8_9PEZI